MFDVGWFFVIGAGRFVGEKTKLSKVNTGVTVVWLMNGLTPKQATYVTTVSDLNWSIVTPR